MGHEDVVWRADTGAYHARASGYPVLMPPMLAALGASTTREASPACVACDLRAWLASPAATNLLLIALLIAILYRGK